MTHLRGMATLLATIIVTAPVGAQRREPAPKPPESLAPLQTTQPDATFSSSRVAESAAGRAGQRQKRDAVAGISPMARVDNRFANRVQNRLRNRLDRFYDPQANAGAPFAVAADQVKTVDPKRRR